MLNSVRETSSYVKEASEILEETPRRDEASLVFWEKVWSQSENILIYELYKPIKLY